jgi:hypothetical protein
MIRKNDQKLGDLIRIIVGDRRMKPHLYQKKLEERWPEMMGPGISRETRSMKLKNQTLILEIHSPALRQELHFAREKIRERVNELFEEDYVELVIVR